MSDNLSDVPNETQDRLEKLKQASTVREFFEDKIPAEPELKLNLSWPVPQEVLDNIGSNITYIRITVAGVSTDVIVTEPVEIIKGLKMMGIIVEGQLTSAVQAVEVHLNTVQAQKVEDGSRLIIAVDFTDTTIKGTEIRVDPETRTKIINIFKDGDKVFIASIKQGHLLAAVNLVISFLKIFGLTKRLILTRSGPQALMKLVQKSVDDHIKENEKPSDKPSTVSSGVTAKDMQETSEIIEDMTNQ
jgi:hypothetical protein